MFDEAERRDPGHQRDWIALADGDKYQIGLIADQAAAAESRSPSSDFIHVLEYLWRAAWCIDPPRPRNPDWIPTQALDILHGRTPQVITRIRQLAGDNPPKPGREHKKIIRKTLRYLEAKQPYLDYPGPSQRWPVATGVIEGACRHLVNDRMGITGARWSLPAPKPSSAARHRANGDQEPTGTTRSTPNTSTTTSAATPAPLTSPHDARSRRAAPA